jgi:flagellar biosynthesis protein FlhB
MYKEVSTLQSAHFAQDLWRIVESKLICGSFAYTDFMQTLHLLLLTENRDIFGLQYFNDWNWIFFSRVIGYVVSFMFLLHATTLLIAIQQRVRFAPQRFDSKAYFLNEGFHRWKNIYSNSTDCNFVQLEIRKGMNDCFSMQFKFPILL